MCFFTRHVVVNIWRGHTVATILFTDRSFFQTWDKDIVEYECRVRIEENLNFRRTFLGTWKGPREKICNCRQEEIAVPEHELRLICADQLNERDIAIRAFYFFSLTKTLPLEFSDNIVSVQSWLFHRFHSIFQHDNASQCLARNKSTEC